jgi:type IV pilus assembly protein PilQ
MDAIKTLIAILDQPEPQVEIETRIVVATRNFSRDIGVQLAGLVTNSGRASGISMGTMAGPTGGVTVPPTLPATSASGLGAQLVNTAIGLTTGIFGTAQLSSLITCR